jgi:hypothetical protein
MLENKLAWAPGSIDTILAGGEPEETVVKLRRDNPERRYDSFTTDALSRASTEELLLELRRRIVRPRDRRPTHAVTGRASTRKAIGPNRASSTCGQRRRIASSANGEPEARPAYSRSIVLI